MLPFPDPVKAVNLIAAAFGLSQAGINPLPHKYRRLLVVPADHVFKACASLRCRPLVLTGGSWAAQLLQRCVHPIPLQKLLRRKILPKTTCKQTVSGIQCGGVAKQTRLGVPGLNIQIMNIKNETKNRSER